MTFSQGTLFVNNSFPTDYFGNPLEIPLILSGTFGELRPNHFHAGLDIKTQQKDGLNVLASASGYVSRIKISHWGYGKVIYVTHPNGFTTVYAHLQKFNNNIETYLKKQQYKKESFEIELFPSANELPISKGEIIALSGSTGGYAGPHLHFEIRDSRTEETINPMLFGIEIDDTIKPSINSLMGYSLSENSYINNSSIPTQIPYKTLANGDLLANKITAYGTIGFGINSFDQLNGAYNKNGVYSLKILVNGNIVHEFIAEKTAFVEGKYINLLIDYERYVKTRQTIQKCYTEPANKLNMFAVSVNNGFINIENGKDYNVDIIAADFKGNSKKITIPVLGKKMNSVITSPVDSTAYKIISTEFHQFNKDGITVAFPKNTFYNDFYLDFEVNKNVVKVHNPTIPLNGRYTLTFDVSNYTDSEKKTLYIASINSKGGSSYESTVKKENSFYTSTKSLGKFTLKNDLIAPRVIPHNFNNNQWLTNSKTLQVKISDQGSGIDSYRGEIDGEWILMEYSVKTGLLTYDFNDKTFNEAKHELKVTVTDNVGNTSTLNTTFYRKK
ncbi:M23 family metallopeptidase [Lutibacter sp. HS1-25]|uniref:M23 family metallopeptidase n=1 Tax=Lutibacter sp. HS1-25 TaxID=2485000 RepID=UPI001F0B90F9|nr:M23 family metallopeptidase [Lutibacter sp. HS1-25]